MSAFSSATSSFPVASRSTVTGGESGVEYVSVNVAASGESTTVWLAALGVSSASPVPSKFTR